MLFRSIAVHHGTRQHRNDAELLCPRYFPFRTGGNGIDPDSQWDQVHVYREFFTFFRSTEEVHRLTPRRIESPFTFGKPFRISDYFGDDRVALLYVNNLMSFSTANPYVTRFGMNKPENQDTLNAMKALMNHAL